ncbi:MAG: thymidine phosphorylase [Methylocystis sp.]|nr:thymidine phosphorylase [Methylocystis sp.]MCA3583652.1 thymidine phosphorylase [Methylocystis sp.]MCA3587852.1 thymidine phosphorylase [Methylocystis sp.]MCA3593134.1 thymidine phosphorylase [Methylocystis sp.]
MLPQEIIRRKRDGATLTGDEIGFMVRGLSEGSVTEGQVAAFAMAIFFRGMVMPERAALTEAMRDSGRVLDWRDLPGPALDKHSTGGIGDTVSLMLAPAVAACGGFVPMISGRGLGHTGGTLDKLDSIPGYVSQPDERLFRQVTRDVGCAIIGQTSDLAPADKRFYAIRDVTATVESIPLITASILSKKLAAGLAGLAMDVKFGNGAFMASFGDAVELAQSLATVATGAGLPTTALLTDMNQPLASAAGNAVEMRHAIDYLTGRRREPRIHEVTVALGAEMLLTGKLAGSLPEARFRLEHAIASGAAAERFARMVTALGGPADLLERPDSHLPAAPFSAAVPAPDNGYAASIDSRGLGVAVVVLGGGRARAADPIDAAVGLTGIVPLGARVTKGDPLAIVHARSEEAFHRAAQSVTMAYGLSDAPPAIGPLIARRLEGQAS